MFFTRRILRPLCAILIGALLFAQAAFAVRPCVDKEMSAAAAISASQEHDCCEPAVTEINLCVAKCKDDSNHSGRDSLKVPEMPVAVALPFPTIHPVSLMPGAGWREPVAIADPPLTLRYGRLLI
jgi:hypothetical protein